MIALVTGDTGFIGSNMRDFLIKKNVEVIGFSRRRGFDIFDLDQLRKAVKKCDLVYHFAAEAKPGESILNPVHTVEVNLKGSLNVLEACRQIGVPLIYPSSCEIYGDSEIPIKEDFPINPPNPYAASKAAIDRICYTYYRCYGLDVKILRLFNPYGPRQQLNKIMPNFYFEAVRNKPITVYGDGTDTRDYVYIDDIVKGLWLARRLPAGEVVNLSTGKATTNLEVAHLIKEILGSKSKIIFVDYPRAFGGIKNQVGSYEKAKRLIGWKPETSLREGLKRTIEWLNRINLEK
ncbi:TPA: NAD-dependent epimerase/dehydratase family protein [Candidatus Bathyarchaeota archaeon]|nr:NAD-dependent epimerase/dehydratase family protein [Candidatus Bathyarchaeota archaeon]